MQRYGVTFLLSGLVKTRSVHIYTYIFVHTCGVEHVMSVHVCGEFNQFIYVPPLAVGEALSYELSGCDAKLILSARSEDKLAAVREKLKSPADVRYVCALEGWHDVL